MTESTEDSPQEVAKENLIIPVGASITEIIGAILDHSGDKQATLIDIQAVLDSFKTAF